MPHDRYQNLWHEFYISRVSNYGEDENDVLQIYFQAVSCRWHHRRDREGSGCKAKVGEQEKNKI